MWSLTMEAKQYFMSAPLSKNAVFAFQISCELLHLARFMEKLVDGQSSSLTKGSVYHIKRVYIQPFTTQKFNVSWKYLVSFIFADTAFLLKVHSFIVCCNAAALPMYRLLFYHSATQRTALKFTSLQYCTAVVGAETEIQPLQLTAMQL